MRKKTENINNKRRILVLAKINNFIFLIGNQEVIVETLNVCQELTLEFSRLF